MTNLICVIEDCDRAVHNKTLQLCTRCYQYQWRNNPNKPDCKVENCQLKSSTAGYCGGHYKRYLRYGDPLAGNGSGQPGIKRGIRNMEGHYVTKNGYRKIRLDDIVGRDKWILEHRYVMEQQLGRKLFSNENVHHINGDTLDNRPENLELWISNQPSGQRVEDLLVWAHEIIELYGS